MGGDETEEVAVRRARRLPRLRAPRSTTGWLVAGIVLVALVLRLLTAQAGFVTTDEGTWMRRSDTFRQGLADGNFGSASAVGANDAGDSEATMPGVTTMWVGAAAEAAWMLGQDWGFWADGDVNFLDAASGLQLAQAVMAAATAALLGLLTFLLSRWLGLAAAAVAGLLLATEPFFVAHGAVLHTDELTALFGGAALVAAALVLGVPHETSWAGGRRPAIVAGALFGGALLTKLTSLIFLPGIALLGAWALVVAVRRAGSGPDRRAAALALARLGGLWLAAAAVVTFVAYPALWVEPLTEYRALQRSMSLAGEGHLQYFLGDLTRTPGVRFYAVTLPLRTTPWFLLAIVVAAVEVWHRATRQVGLALLAMGAPAFALLSITSKQFDRYGMPVLVVCAIAVGVVGARAVEIVRERHPRRRRLGGAAAGAVAALLVAHSLAVAPWGLAYYNPALGGGRAAVNNVMVGWREGVEQAGGIIADYHLGSCDGVTVYGGQQSGYACGRRSTDRRTATYVVVYISERQRFPRIVEGLTADRRLVGTFVQRGITYVEVYGPRR